MNLRTEILSSKHEKRNFECGVLLLDSYIKTQAKQDVSRDLSACFVLVDDQNFVKGYYTLSASSIKKADFPEQMARKLPSSYEQLPTILLGRFAIDKTIQGKGFGRVLLISALRRCLEISKSLGSLAVIVDPVDKNAEGFYSAYGFILISSTGKMLLPIKTIVSLIG